MTPELLPPPANDHHEPQPHMKTKYKQTILTLERLKMNTELHSALLHERIALLYRQIWHDKHSDPADRIHEILQARLDYNTELLSIYDPTYPTNDIFRK